MRHAIAIGVHPHLELGKNRVGCVDFAVVIGVGCGQRGKGGHNLKAIVNLAIAIAVIDQKAFARRCPGGCGLGAGGIDVKLHIGRRQICGVHLAAGKIEDQGVATARSATFFATTTGLRAGRLRIFIAGITTAVIIIGLGAGV